jgi:hypothetical protein
MSEKWGMGNGADDIGSIAWVVGRWDHQIAAAGYVVCVSFPPVGRIKVSIPYL